MSTSSRHYDIPGTHPKIMFVNKTSMILFIIRSCKPKSKAKFIFESIQETEWIFGTQHLFLLKSWSVLLKSNKLKDEYLFIYWKFYVKEEDISPDALIIHIMHELFVISFDHYKQKCKVDYIENGKMPINNDTQDIWYWNGCPSKKNQNEDSNFSRQFH